jgi:hypothetical protein
LRDLERTCGEASDREMPAGSVHDGNAMTKTTAVDSSRKNKESIELGDSRSMFELNSNDEGNSRKRLIRQNTR